MSAQPWAAALIVLVVASGHARAIPPDPGIEESAVPDTVSRDHVLQVRLGKHVAKYEKTTLDEIRAWAGAGIPEGDGDASTARSWLCYSFPGQMVWFVSTEMGGLTRFMELYGEAVSESDPRFKQCPSLPESLRPIEFDFGWVGSSEAAFRKVLGPPSRVHGEWSQYSYAGKERGPYRDLGSGKSKTVEYDVGAFIEARFQNGKAVAVRASHVTSY